MLTRVEQKPRIVEGNIQRIHIVGFLLGVLACQGEHIREGELLVFPMGLVLIVEPPIP